MGAPMSAGAWLQPVVVIKYTEYCFDLPNGKKLNRP
jgi:hypothetical protein